MILIFVPVNGLFKLEQVQSVSRTNMVCHLFQSMKCISGGSLRILQRALTTLERHKRYVYMVNCQCGCVKLILYTNRQFIVAFLRTSVYTALATHNYTDECTPLSESLSPFKKLKNLNGSMLLKRNYVKVVNFMQAYLYFRQQYFFNFSSCRSYNCHFKLTFLIQNHTCFFIRTRPFS